MTWLWLVQARPRMQLISWWLCVKVAYYLLMLDMLSHWQLNIASDCTIARNKKYRISGIFRLDSMSSLGIEQCLCLIVWAVVLTHVVAQPTHQQSNSSLGSGLWSYDRSQVLNWAFLTFQTTAETAIHQTSSPLNSLKIPSSSLQFGDSEGPYECESWNRMISQISSSFMGYLHTKMKFEWISQINPSTDHPSSIKQWVRTFNVLVLASSTHTVCIMINWRRLTRFLVLWDLPLESG